MLDWVITAAVLIVGFIVMITGFIEYVLLGWILYLLIMVVMGFLGRIWLCFQEPNNK